MRTLDHSLFTNLVEELKVDTSFQVRTVWVLKVTIWGRTYIFSFKIRFSEENLLPVPLSGCLGTGRIVGVSEVYFSSLVTFGQKLLLTSNPEFLNPLFELVWGDDGIMTCMLVHFYVFTSAAEKRGHALLPGKISAINKVFFIMEKRGNNFFL